MSDLILAKVRRRRCFFLQILSSFFGAHHQSSNHQPGPSALTLPEYSRPSLRTPSLPTLTLPRLATRTHQSFGATGPSERPRVPRSLVPLRPYKTKAPPRLLHFRGGGRKKRSNLLLWLSFAAVLFAGTIFIFNGFFLTSRMLAGTRAASLPVSSSPRFPPRGCLFCPPSRPHTAEWSWSDPRGAYHTKQCRRFFFFFFLLFAVKELE